MADAQSDGVFVVPVARLAEHLRHTPPDLTQFTKRNGGTFPRELIRRIIDGRDVPVHGDRDMPVWGRRFYAQTHDERAVRALIGELVAYLQSIQTGARRAHK